MMMDEEGQDDWNKGPLKYQEQKEFNSEPHLVNVYDNQAKRIVNFEVYGLDTQGQLNLKYEYQAFDSLFRFNAELLNPNRKEGRFHWVIERLEIQQLPKGVRKLKLGEKPTEEVSDLPIYETIRKIPTGRMDLKQRQELREKMDMLDIKREENIAKMRAATKERFLKHIFALKEEDKRRKEEQQQKIEAELANRHKQKEEMDRREEEELRILEQKNKIRRRAVEVRVQRSVEQEEYELAQLRLRWRASDAEKARLIQAARERRAKMQKEADAAKAVDEAEKADALAKRQIVWKTLEDRKARRESDWLKKIDEVKEDLKRVAKATSERNQEFLKEWARERWPTFQQALIRTEERREAREAEEQAMQNYHLQRAIPPKVKTKGANAKKMEEEQELKVPAEKRPKTKKVEKGGDNDKKKKDESAADHVEKVLDSVETKMRAEMEEEKRREKLDKIRQDKVGQKERARVEAQLKRLTQVRETHRQKKAEEERVAAERHLIYQTKCEEIKKNAERQKQEAERLQRVRDTNIERIEKALMAKILA